MKDHYTFFLVHKQNKHCTQSGSSHWSPRCTDYVFGTWLTWHVTNVIHHQLFHKPTRSRVFIHIDLLETLKQPHLSLAQINKILKCKRVFSTEHVQRDWESKWEWLLPVAPVLVGLGGSEWVEGWKVKMGGQDLLDKLWLLLTNSGSSCAAFP